VPRKLQRILIGPAAHQSEQQPARKRIPSADAIDHVGELQRLRTHHAVARMQRRAQRERIHRVRRPRRRGDALEFR